MDNIPYPRALNRPTYLVWRFTHKDVTAIMVVLIVLFAPSAFSSDYPVNAALLLSGLYILYRGAIVQIKPRGWEGHKLAALVQPDVAGPGHCFHRCFITDSIDQPKPKVWQKAYWVQLRDRMRRR